MTGSRAQALALRRRLLQAEASIQRLRLQRDAALLVDAANPAAWMQRVWGREAGPSRLAWLPIAALALRRFGSRRRVAGALLAWQLWRRLQRRKPGHP
jgi:hypothetical protein